MKKSGFSALFLLATLFLAASVFADCQQGRALYERALNENDLSRRIMLLRESLTQCKNFAVAYELGKALANSGERQKAEDTLREAADMAGDNVNKAKALSFMAQLYLSQGKKQEAITYLRLSYNLHPFPRVLEALKGLESEVAARPVMAADIKRSLRFSDRAFGVEPKATLRIHFELNKAELNEEGRRQADELGQALQDPSFQNRTFTFIGHTDKRGTEEYNLDLSQRRADTVKRYLVGKFGFDPNRLTAEGHGKREPLYPGDTEQDHALNRRVEVK